MEAVYLGDLALVLAAIAVKLVPCLLHGADVGKDCGQGSGPDPDSSMRHQWHFLVITRAENPRVAAICELCGLTRVSRLPATDTEGQIDVSGTCPAREGERSKAITDAVFQPNKG